MAEFQQAQLESVKKPAPKPESRVRERQPQPAHPLLGLQARAGNQAIARMVQRAAEEDEMQMKHDRGLQRESEAEEEESVQAKHDAGLQRESEAEEEESVQAKHDAGLQRESEAEEEESVQAKHDPGLQRESEAEEEESVQAKHDAGLQRESEAEEEESVQAKHDPAVQRAGEEDEMMMKRDAALQRRDDAPRVGLEGGPVGADIESQVNGMRGGGSSVPDGIRRQMEAATGANLGGVRVHQGKEADSLNRQLTAKAFTTGSDIFLRGDQSPADSHLMAHELSHVVQQSSGRVAAGGQGMTAGAANDPLEADADRLADAVVSGNAQRIADEARR